MLAPIPKPAGWYFQWFQSIAEAREFYRLRRAGENWASAHILAYWNTQPLPF